jgi:hypothetical protein
MEFFRALTTSTETPLLAIIFRVPMPSVSPYLNPHISAESRRMKTTNRPYFISPTHKRTEGRAPVWGSEFTLKDAALQGVRRNRC